MYNLLHNYNKIMYHNVLPELCTVRVKAEVFTQGHGSLRMPNYEICTSLYHSLRPELCRS